MTMALPTQPYHLVSSSTGTPGNGEELVHGQPAALSRALGLEQAISHTGLLPRAHQRPCADSDRKASQHPASGHPCPLACTGSWTGHVSLAVDTMPGSANGGHSGVHRGTDVLTRPLSNLGQCDHPPWVPAVATSLPTPDTGGGCGCCLYPGSPLFCHSGRHSKDTQLTAMGILALRLQDAGVCSGGLGLSIPPARVPPKPPGYHHSPTVQPLGSWS